MELRETGAILGVLFGLPEPGGSKGEPLWPKTDKPTTSTGHEKIIREENRMVFTK